MSTALKPEIRSFIDQNLTSEMREDGALNLGTFATKIGINKIFLARFNKDGVSGLLKKEGDEWNIYVNHTDSPRRRRFTIAHEIGHFISYLTGGESASTLKDKGQVSDIAFTRATALHSKMEAEANAIAAHILMPEADVRDLLSKGKTVEEMAKYFQVSESAMLVRLDSLSITTFESYGRGGAKTD